MGASGAAKQPDALRVEFNRPKLYPKQEAAIYEPKRYSFIEAGTKAGKTSGCIVWITEQAVNGKPGWQYWWVAPIFAQAKIAFRRLVESLSPGTFEKNETEMSVKMCDKAKGWVAGTIVFKGADKPDSLYGEDVHAAVVDEASRVKEESWHAVRSTLTATRGPVRCIGNVKGRKNWFYKLSRNAGAGSADSALHRITCYDAVHAGVLAAEEIESAKSQLPEAVFKQLYEAEAADDEGNPFGIAAIEECAVAEMPSTSPIVWGWDFAKSNDWTVGVALDRDGNVCRLVRFQMPWGPTKERIKFETGRAKALGDSTGVGDPIVEDLQKMNMDVEGYVFTSRSKQQLMEGLAADIQQRQVRFPRGVLTDELDAFEYTYTQTGVRYSAPEGMHDDCVCALALARMIFRRGYGQPFVFQRLRADDGGERSFQMGDVWRSNRSSILVD